MGKPSTPDYVGAAQTQGQENIAAEQTQAALNTPNVSTPYGSQTVNYTTDSQGNLTPNITDTLTPQATSALNSQLNVQQGEANLANQGLNTASGLLATPFQSTAPSATSALAGGIAPSDINAGQDAYSAQMAYLQPQINQQRDALTQQLANQGIPIGSQAYQNAEMTQGDQIGSLEDQAASNAVGLQQGANAQGYNEALGAYQQQLAQYNQPLNEITALMSGSQIQNPQFQSYAGGGTLQAPNTLGATEQQGNANTAAYNSSMTGLGGLLGGIGAVAAAPSTSIIGTLLAGL